MKVRKGGRRFFRKKKKGYSRRFGIQTISLSLIWMPELFCWNCWKFCWCAGADGELTLLVVNDGTVKWVEFEAKGIPWLCNPPPPFDENSALEWLRPPFVWLDCPFWRIIRIWKKEIWICSRVPFKVSSVAPAYERTTVRRNFDPYLHFFQLMLSCYWFKEVYMVKITS